MGGAVSKFLPGVVAEKYFENIPFTVFNMSETKTGDVSLSGFGNTGTDCFFKQQNSPNWIPYLGSRIELQPKEKVSFRFKNPSYDSISVFCRFFAGEESDVFEVYGNLKKFKSVDFSDYIVSAKNLLLNCEYYERAFYECKYLKTPPAKLPALQYIPSSCYEEMFYVCQSLETAPQLVLGTASLSCCSSMFYGCSSLVDSSNISLPATVLDAYCYEEMFCICSSLETAPELPATELGTECYKRMFRGCTNLKTAPELPATELSKHCYESMFADCSNLKEITVHFSDWGSVDSTYKWVSGVASHGVFRCPKELEIIYDDSHIPPGWDVVTF